MKRNVELKARLPDLAKARQVAESLAAPLHQAERQRDTYFRVPRGRLKLRQRWSIDPHCRAESWAPCAEDRPSQLIWYHRSNEPHARPSNYSLVELAAGSGDALCELLVGSLGAIVEVTKFRTVYLYQNVRIHLDEVPNLGTFLEFEAIVDDGCDDTAAESKVRTLYAAFDLTDSQVCSDSYSDLLRRG